MQPFLLVAGVAYTYRYTFTYRYTYMYTYTYTHTYMYVHIHIQLNVLPRVLEGGMRGPGGYIRIGTRVVGMLKHGGHFCLLLLSLEATISLVCRYYVHTYRYIYTVLLACLTWWPFLPFAFKIRCNHFNGLQMLHSHLEVHVHLYVHVHVQEYILPGVWVPWCRGGMRGPGGYICIGTHVVGMYMFMCLYMHMYTHSMLLACLQGGHFSLLLLGL